MFSRYRMNRFRATLLFLALMLLSSVLIWCSGSGQKEAGLPPPPENLRVELAAEGVQVSWDRLPGVSHYTVFWGPDRRQYRRMADVRSESVVVSGLDPGKLYFFAVSAWNTSGESDFSREEAMVYDEDPSRATEHLARGNDLMRQGYFSEANAYISAAIKLDPRLADAYRLRATIHEQMNKPDLARQDYAMAQKLFGGGFLPEGKSTN